MPTPCLSSTRTVSLALIVALILSASAERPAGARAIAQPAATPLLQSGEPTDVPVVHDAFVSDLGPIGALAGEGDLVVAGAGLHLIRIDADASPPAEMARSDRLPGVVEAVVLGDGHAFVAMGEAGLAIVALPPDERLPVVATLSLESDARELLLVEGRLYVAAGMGGLHVIDVSDPERPRRLGSLDRADVEALGSGINAIAWHEGELVVVGERALAKVDVSQPGIPVVRATFDLGRLMDEEVISARPLELVVVGDHAYLPAWPPLAFDIAAPDRITMAGPGSRYTDTFCQPFVGGLYEDEVMFQHDGSLVLAAESKIFVFDLSDPTRPMPRNQAGIGYGAILSVLPLADRALVAWEEGLSVLEGSLEASGMVERGCMSMWQDDFDGMVFEDPLFDVRDGVGILSNRFSNGLAVLDVGDPSTPRLAAVTDLAVDEVEVIADVHLMEQRAVVGLVDVESSAQLEIWDVAEPDRPRLLGGHVYAEPEGGGYPWISDIESAGDHLLVLRERRARAPLGENEVWLEVLDVSEPAEIREVARLSVTTQGHAHQMRWGQDGVLWITVSDVLDSLPDGDEPPPSVFAVDVNDPLDPRVLGSLVLRDEDGQAVAIEDYTSFAVGSDRGYVGTEDGILAFDASQPSSPTVLAKLGLPCQMESFAARGDLLFCSVIDRVEVYDLAALDSPTLASSTGLLGEHWNARLEISGGLLFLLSTEDIRVLDIEDPRGNPRLVEEEGSLGRKTLVGLGDRWGLVRYGYWSHRCAWMSGSGALAMTPVRSDWTCPWEVAAIPGSDRAVGLTGRDRDVLSVLDFSTDEPRTLSELSLVEDSVNRFHAIAANEGLAIAVAEAALIVAGLDDPLAPQVLSVIPVAELAESGELIDVFASAPVVVGDRAAFVLVRTQWATNDEGDLAFDRSLVALDLSDASRPRAAGRLALGSCVSGCTSAAMDLMDDARHLIVQHHGVPAQVIDVSDINRLRVVAQLESPAGAMGRIATAGPWVWTTSREEPDMVHQFLLADPRTPREISRRVLPGGVRDLAAAGDQVFVMDAKAGPLRLRIGAGLRAAELFLPALGR